MKTRVKKLSLVPALIAGLTLLMAGQATAQKFTTLHSFAGVTGVNVNSDGASPQAGVILSGNTVYGTANVGGSSGSGTVFKINTDGTRLTILHTFDALVFSTNSDGANPNAGLILSGNILYGTAKKGGSGGGGTVFAVNTDGTDFQTLHNFTSENNVFANGDGANPVAGLILSGNTLYGTASSGGGSGNGTVFAVNTNGTGFATL